MSYRSDEPKPLWPVITAGVLGCIVVVGLLVGAFMGLKAMGRYQKRQDAMNQVKVSEIMIRNQEQRVKITQQEAQIRIEGAKGIRAAQDEIASTLTPLFVQFEMVEALKEIARSGRNNSVVFMPAGATGVPLVYDTGKHLQVQPPKEEGE